MNEHAQSINFDLLSENVHNVHFSTMIIRSRKEYFMQVNANWTFSNQYDFYVWNGGCKLLIFFNFFLSFKHSNANIIVDHGATITREVVNSVSGHTHTQSSMFFLPRTIRYLSINFMHINKIYANTHHCEQ